MNSKVSTPHGFILEQAAKCDAYISPMQNKFSSPASSHGEEETDIRKYFLETCCQVSVLQIVSKRKKEKKKLNKPQLSNQEESNRKVKHYEARQEGFEVSKIYESSGKELFVSLNALKIEFLK